MLPSSEHAVFTGLKPSGGHAADVPVQSSGKSHSPAGPRQTVCEFARTSAGQALLLPLHVSGASQSPAAARHVVELPSFASAGQASEVPSHISTASQTPAAPRHTLPDGIGEQVPALPWTLHDWQSVVSPPPQDVEQHTPSTQLPPTHSFAAPHCVPGDFFVMQVPPAQYWLVEHCESFVHPPEHTLPLHAWTVHCCVCTGGHCAPFPGQLAPSVAVAGVPPQLGSRHVTLLEA
jgi:hypothetical protein